ncbi:MULTISPECIES: signal peptidase I [Caproicibacterium]|jgi:signal peptidase I|uniref:Signal peptidase I n=3 Tax=Caproicibacterium lactatifermentans TaxID=2666138 RepID=A0ABX6PU75_9FIRM|nr:signal peptidase I [Caproicibacterium lactatifermentans]ARP50738.1 signal peptidase I [Ruminococcaceae bacterium CPB6]MDD4807021.1 signal peptidase I [Oscillospiraceae bacterium]QKO29793.1 signal peptidase I [Caproicibacterium lactatifermentans]
MQPDEKETAVSAAADDVPQTPDAQPEQESAHPDHKITGVLSWIMTMGITVAAVLLVCTFIARPGRVSGNSMQNTCHDGDFVILWELNYQPQHGDIVVVNSNNALGDNLIKRVIGVGGDHIVVSNGVVIRNGQRLQESYVKEQTWSGPNVDITVPKGQMFLMGDNRNHSADSRYIGTVSDNIIVGKVTVRLFPFNAIRTFQ